MDILSQSNFASIGTFQKSAAKDGQLLAAKDSYHAQYFGDQTKAADKWEHSAKLVVQDYYRLTTGIYLFGGVGTNLHFGVRMPWDNFKSASIKQNYRVAVKLEAKPTDSIIVSSVNLVYSYLWLIYSVVQ